MVTAAAALATGKFTPDSRFDDPGYCTEYGKQVRNAGNPRGARDVRQRRLHAALAHSINSVFCNIGKAIGAGTILDQAKRFGFYQLPPLETPANERAPSGLYNERPALRPEQAESRSIPAGSRSARSGWW